MILHFRKYRGQALDRGRLASKYLIYWTEMKLYYWGGCACTIKLCGFHNSFRQRISYASFGDISSSTSSICSEGQRVSTWLSVLIYLEKLRWATVAPFVLFSSVLVQAGLALNFSKRLWAWERIYMMGYIHLFSWTATCNTHLSLSQSRVAIPLKRGSLKYSAMSDLEDLAFWISKKIICYRSYVNLLSWTAMRNSCSFPSILVRSCASR